MLWFKVDVSNGVYEVNVCMPFKSLNNIKLCATLAISTLNHDHKMNSIHFISNTLANFY
jgi:hypothetical protein